MTQRSGTLPPTTVRLSADLLKRIEVEAKRRRATRSDVIRDAVEQALPDEEISEDER